MRDFNGVIVSIFIICHGFLLVLEKSVIYPGLLSCFLVILFDDIFLRQRTLRLLFVIA